MKRYVIFGIDSYDSCGGMFDYVDQTDDLDRAIMIAEFYSGKDKRVLGFDYCHVLDITNNTIIYDTQDGGVCNKPVERHRQMENVDCDGNLIYTKEEAKASYDSKVFKGSEAIRIQNALSVFFCVKTIGSVCYPYDFVVRIDNDIATLEQIGLTPSNCFGIIP